MRQSSGAFRQIHIATVAVRKLILKSFLSPGDIVMMTAAVRDLHQCYPRRFLTDVRTSCAELWENNPYITPLNEGDPGVETIHCSYPLINRCNELPYHCLHGYIEFLNRRLHLAITPTAFRGDIHISELEKSWYSQVYELTKQNIRFWIVAAGGKYDVTIKWWDTSRFQAVIDHFRGKIQFVQVGEHGHHHPRLSGVIDLRGKTNLRELVRLVYHSQGVLCPVTSLMHLAAAVEFKHNPAGNRPCVVIGGGREPAHWEAYPDHQFIHTNGMLACCTRGGCWKDRTVPLGDGDVRDQQEHLCVDVVHSPHETMVRSAGFSLSEAARQPKGWTTNSNHSPLPRCMSIITPEEVIRRIESYFDGRIVDYLKPTHLKARRRAVRATAKNEYDNQPLNLNTARPAFERFAQNIPDYPGGFTGRGIVICGGGLRYFPAAWVCINMLRHLGCALPIELWHLGSDEMDRQMCKLLEPLNVTCVDAYQVRKRFPVRKLNGWELKAYAILRSRFREVLFLDADNVPVVNPEFLFNSPPYQKCGALFWPDYGRFKKTQIIWDLLDLDRPAGPEFESGQIVIDKRLCWKALSLAMWFNEHSDFFYQYLHGDKETFHLAFCKLKKSFALPSRAIQGLVGTMCQHDSDGRRIFQHRNTDKWNLFIENLVVPGFRFDAECRTFLRQLQQLWDGHTSRYVPRRSRRQEALINSGPLGFTLLKSNQKSEPPHVGSCKIQLAACMISCPERKVIRERTLDSFNRSDWGDRAIHVQIDQGRLPTRQDCQTRTACLALRHVLEKTDANYIVFLEDDLEANRFFFHNLLHWRPLLEGRVTLAGLYNPGVQTVACDVKRQALIVHPESIYGSQAFLLSRRAAAYILKHWDRVQGMQDIKLSRLAARLKQPIFYHFPSLIQHVGKQSTWGGHFHRSHDYQPKWRAIH